MTPEEKRAYVLADNKLALNAGWDEDLLAQELEALQDLDLDFSLEVTGFSIAEIDNLIDGLIPRSRMIRLTMSWWRTPHVGAARGMSGSLVGTGSSVATVSILVWCPA
jgi:hypothetical protein